MSLKIGKPYNLYELLLKADAGDKTAMFDVVCAIDIDGLGVDDPDGEIAARRISYLKELAQTEGYENAMIMLGTSYQTGRGVERDAAEAIRWFEKAVAAGIPFGNECIGSVYYYGDGMPVDYQKAFDYFTRDDSTKAFCTTYALGEMYRRGLYVERDPGKAAKYYGEIVYSSSSFKEKDDYYWRACYRLAMALHYGWGTGKDIKEALALIAKARGLFAACGMDDERTDVSKEDLYREWLLINQDADAY